MKLYPKFLIALAITVGLMLLSVFYIIWQADKALVERQKASFARESRLLIDEVDRMLFERFHNVQTFSLSLGDIEPGKLAYISTSPEMIAKLNSLVVNYQAYRRIAIFDTDGSLLAANSRNAQGRTLQGIFIPKQ
ncbi:hypothetical protein [Aliagarivorans taiwanensis]|nr:hypothetical protein [Aliagarivorans taiwanensis]